MSIRILFCGGGTAGHVNPALAIAATIQQKNPDADMMFVSSAKHGDIAHQLVPRAGYELRQVHIQGMSRPLYSPSNIKTVCLMAISRIEAKRIIRNFAPDIIIGTGGFACWPILSMGADMNIPTLMHESNAAPGLAVSRLKHKVDKILVNFPETAQKLFSDNGKDKVVRVGNPHMPGFISDGPTLSRKKSRQELGLCESDVYVLSFGGSRGSETLNDAIISMCDTLLSACPNIVLHHGTGHVDYSRSVQALTQKSYAASERVKFLDYIYDMPKRMAAADIVISRAGAMSVSEIALLAKAAILVPSPNVTDGHQYKNAKALEDAGAGICVEEKDLYTGVLEEKVKILARDISVRERMGHVLYEKFASPDANDRIYEEILKLIKL